MEYQRQGYDTVGYGLPEIFPIGRIIQQRLARQRRDHKQCVKKDNADNALFYRGLSGGGASHKDGCHRKQTHLLMAGIGIEVADILEENDLSPGSQDGGKDDGLQADMVLQR